MLIAISVLLLGIGLCMCGWHLWRIYRRIFLLEAMVGTPSASHNSVRDVICPTCKGAGFTPNIFDSKIKVPCILCNESGKLHP